jgi:hypothetical protein
VAGVPDELADRLYVAPPDGFVAARDAAMAAARAAGDPALAKEIAKLRKPTIAAWLVNLLALRRPELVAELVHLAGALRTAQRELRGAELRELSTQRRAAVAALVASARELAVAEDPNVDPAKLPLAEVEATLTAALSDVDVAAQLREGRLIRPVVYAGFGEVPRPQLRLVTGGAGTTTTAPADEGRAGLRRRDEAPPEEPVVDRAAIRREMAAARTAQQRAEADLERATAAEDDGAQVLAKLETEIAELERRRATAEEELSRRKLARKAAERALSLARRRFGEAQGAIEALDPPEPTRPEPAPDARRTGGRGKRG